MRPHFFERVGPFRWQRQWWSVPSRGRVMRGNSRKLTFVPEGPNDRSQVIYCLEQVRLKIRAVGHSLILTHGWLVVLIVARLSDPSYRPYGTDPF
jgi:hypothetical protein